MSYFIPPHSGTDLPENKYFIFGKEGGKRLAEDYDIPFLGQIPLVQSIREGGDIGIPVMVSDDKISQQSFMEFAGLTARSIAMRNAQMSAPKVVEVLE